MGPILASVYAEVEDKCLENAMIREINLDFWKKMTRSHTTWWTISLGIKIRVSPDRLRAIRALI